MHAAQLLHAGLLEERRRRPLEELRWLCVRGCFEEAGEEEDLLNLIIV